MIPLRRKGSCTRFDDLGMELQSQCQHLGDVEELHVTVVDQAMFESGFQSLAEGSQVTVAVPDLGLAGDELGRCPTRPHCGQIGLEVA